MIRAAIASLATAALFTALPALAQQKTQSPPATVNPQAQLPGHAAFSASDIAALAEVAAATREPVFLLATVGQ